MIFRFLKSIAKKFFLSPIFHAIQKTLWLLKKNCIKRKNYYLAMKTVNFMEKNRAEKILLLVGIPCHGNIGDHAIYVAEKEFLKKHFFDYLLVEFDTECFLAVAKEISRRSFKKMTVLIHGGGFLGNLWLNEENMFRTALKVFANNKILSFPQTIFFDERQKNFKKELKKTCASYNSHPNLTIFIRDKSVDFLRQKVGFKNTYCVPDIVLSLNFSHQKFKRSGILFCFRFDKEKILSDTEQESLFESAKLHCKKINFTDMTEDCPVPNVYSDFAVRKKMKEFQTASLVVTDRLHAMIFSAISGTPCIASDNISGKVFGVYELWLSDLPYIKFAKNPSQAVSLIPKMLVMGGMDYDEKKFSVQWEKIAKKIQT